MANVTHYVKVKNVSANTPAIYDKYIILPGQVVLVDDSVWYGKEMWKKFQFCTENNTEVRLLEVHNRRDVVNADDSAVIKYAVNEYNKYVQTSTPLEVVVGGITYNGFTVQKGNNSIIFFKEGVVTPILPTAITISGDSEVTVGGTLELSCSFTPATTTEKSVIWLSDDETKATVDPNTGVVTGVASTGTSTVDIHCISVAGGSTLVEAIKAVKVNAATT